MMVLTVSVMMVMTFTLVMALWCLSRCWLANLSKSLLDSRHIGFISIISDCCSFSLQIKNNVLYSTFEILVIRNILQNLIAAVLAMQIYMQHNGLFVRLCLCC